jgi:hypothetical protein
LAELPVYETIMMEKAEQSQGDKKENLPLTTERTSKREMVGTRRLELLTSTVSR